MSDLSHDAMHAAWTCRDTLQGALVHHCLQMGGEHTEAEHVKLMLDCMEVCQTTADMIRRQSAFAQHVANVCADICNACADSCAAIESQHMQECAAVCRQCAAACQGIQPMRKAA